MNQNLSELVEISRFYGRKKDYVIAGGGNTSFKNAEYIWVKASGTSMKEITERGFACLRRDLLKVIYTKTYSEDSMERESEVKSDLYKACLPGITVRPSVETSLHEIIAYPFVVHTHPTLVNAITCAADAEKHILELFGDQALYVQYTDPGYVLFKKIKASLEEWRKNHKVDPSMIFLQNHGVFVSAETTAEIKAIYNHVEKRIRDRITAYPDLTDEAIPENVTEFLPAMRMMLSENSVKSASIRNNRMISEFTLSAEEFTKVSEPFTPDQIVYCKAFPLYLESSTPRELIEEFGRKLKDFTATHGYKPRVVGIRGYGLAAFEDNMKSVHTALDIFEDWMQISKLSNDFGGPHFLGRRDVDFIDSWEVENYRRQVAKTGTGKAGKVENKIVVITGGAQGFGEGITEGMFSEGANVLIADVNEEKGMALAGRLNEINAKNHAQFAWTDVTDADSVKRMIYRAVVAFGGVDILISNAGILKAGSLEEMTPDSFEAITRVNYSGYFLCARSAAPVMKLQTTHRNDYFADIIQINSKSGLKGSNRNFAYAGSKFGSIGLTQSFALELIPFRIKVNAVCPGNFFEGPLWSHPETGLFVQYLKTGKVPGAKSLEDVKAHYEKQVPAGRGCRVGDVMKAIYYIIDQEYETGQALPVTGGQEMLR